MLVTDSEKANEIVKTLSDEYSRKIVLAITSKSMTAEEISKEKGIPTSTCYRRIHSLLSHGMIRVDKTIISDDGKKFVCYLSCFKNASINLEGDGLKVDVVVSDSSRRFDFWTRTRDQKVDQSVKPTLQVPLVKA